MGECNVSKNQEFLAILAHKITEDFRADNDDALDQFEDISGDESAYLAILCYGIMRGISEQDGVRFLRAIADRCK
jgi:hypothetical protein